MSRPRYDAERFLSDVESLFKSKLNDKLAAINSEKLTMTSETTDDFSVGTISDSAWFMSHIPKVWNYPQFVVWGLTGTTIQAPQPGAALQAVSVSIEVVIPDKGEKNKESAIYKLLRYQRALQEVAFENYDEFRHYGKIELESLPPGFVDISGKMLRMSGINITANMEV